MSQIDMKNPENLLKQSKKGRTIMTFVTVSGNPTRQEADEITKIWQTSLWNNHIQAEKSVFIIFTSTLLNVIDFFLLI